MTEPSDNEPPICAIGEHDLMCGCGDSYPHGYDSSHAGICVGCATCHRGNEELSAQERDERNELAGELVLVGTKCPNCGASDSLPLGMTCSEHKPVPIYERLSHILRQGAEALAVLDEWENVYQRCPDRPDMLGLTKAACVLARIEELEAEVHRLHTAEFIGRLPDYVKELEGERDEAADEIQRLGSWKAEALAVLAEWENVWEMAGKPGQLGTSKALSTMYEIERLRAAMSDEEDRMW